MYLDINNNNIIKDHGNFNSSAKNVAIPYSVLFLCSRGDHEKLGVVRKCVQ